MLTQGAHETRKEAKTTGGLGVNKQETRSVSFISFGKFQPEPKLFQMYITQ